MTGYILFHQDGGLIGFREDGIGKGDDDGFSTDTGETINVDFAAGSINVIFDRAPVAADYSFAPATNVYNGTAQSVTVSKVNALVGDVTAVYYNGSTTAPTNAGSYTISIDVAANAGADYTAASGLVLGTYTITKADASALTIVWPTASPITLGSELSASTFSGGSTELGSFAWKDGTTVPTEAGTHAFAVIFTPNAETLANYDIAATVEGSADVLITAVKYDVNGDGRFSIVDVVLVQNYLLDKDTLTANQIVIADVDGDGQVTTADLMNLMRVLARLDVII